MKTGCLMVQLNTWEQRVLLSILCQPMTVALFDLNYRAVTDWLADGWADWWQVCWGPWAGVLVVVEILKNCVES